MRNDKDHLSEVFIILRKPLEFARRQNFMRLHTLKDLENLSCKVIDRAMPLITEPEYKEILERIRELFIDFDKQSLPEKKRRVIEALKIMEEEGETPEKDESDSFISERISERVHHDFNGFSFEENHRSRRLHEGKKKFGDGAGRTNHYETRKAHYNMRAEKVLSGKENIEISLDSPVDAIKGVGRKLKYIFQKRNLNSVFDLLFYLPRDYQDRTNLKKISEFIVGEEVVFSGRIENVEIRPTKRGKVLIASLSDGSDSIKCIWFGSKRKAFLDRIFLMGKKFILWGRVEESNGEKVIYHPDWEEIDEKGSKNSIHFRRITPVYPLFEGLRQKSIRKILYTAFDSLESKIPDLLHPNRLQDKGIPPISEGLRLAHFPAEGTSIQELKEGKTPAQKSVAFHEFLLFSTAMEYMKRENQKKRGCPIKILHSKVGAVLNNLPFKLTDSQERVLSEIKSDLMKPSPLNRLIQGEVGSGKTILALLSSAIVIENEYQVAFLVPTMSLAYQHYRKIKGYLSRTGINIGLLTGSRSEPSKDDLVNGLSRGDIHLLICTHAIFNNRINFSRLGLVIIDEQHRFGVQHRFKMITKGENPHVLVMSATPIPRTLSLTFYGNMDISILDQSPYGMKVSKTEIIHREKIQEVYSAIKEEVKKGNMVFYICPVIDEKNFNYLRDVISTKEYLEKNIFVDFRVKLFHGKLTPDEKIEVMDAIMKGEVDILVCTTLIEVGIDIPNATLMVIENPERFGISQIHQMRGRVGRGQQEGRVFLIISEETPHQSIERIKILENLYNGMDIAIHDLQIRGPGDFFGFRQSGIPDFRAANPIKNSDMMELAREEAKKLLDEDPHLDAENHLVLKKYILKRYGSNILLGSIL